MWEMQSLDLDCPDSSGSADNKKAHCYQVVFTVKEGQLTQGGHSTRAL